MKLLVAAILFVAIILSGFLAWDSWTTGLISAEGYTASVLDVDTDNLVDIGLADVNADGRLDLFTSAHNHRQSLHLGGPSGGFGRNVADSLIPQDADFPGLELSESPPQFADPPRVALYWHNLDLVIRTWGPVQGRLTFRFASRAEVRSVEGWEVEVTADEQGTILSVRADTVGILRVSPRLIAIPVRVELPEALDLSSVEVGRHRSHPPSPSFTMALRDRHGMAWADIDSDGDLDVFIGRGGLQGRMGNFDRDFGDELLIQREGRFTQTSAPGFEKGDCPAYQSAWVDANMDGLLDLYIGCHRGRANQLYLGTGPGFLEAADSFGLAVQDNAFHSHFLWVDIDLDGDLDLLLESGGDLVLHVNERESFTRRVVQPGTGPVAHLAMGDYNGDGFPDVYAASRRSALILINQEGRLEPRDPVTLGLPGEALTAAWIDEDADGLLDLLTVPSGLHRQKPDRTFEATGLFRMPNPRALIEARVQWLDADGDGRLDLVLGMLWDYPILDQVTSRLRGTYRPMWGRYPQNWNVQLFRGQPGKVLQVKLRGSPGNPHAIGGYVDIWTESGTRRLFVGESEHSHYSQGHYRVYVPLSDGESVDSVRATWPDGENRVVMPQPSTSLLVVERNEAAPDL